MHKKTVAIEDLLRQSIINRQNFLEAKKKGWLNCESERKKKKLIVELIQLEPSHLAEDWILDQVIKWMKARQKNIDYIEAAFIAKGKRNELTERQRDNLAKTSFFAHKISKTAEERGSKRAAIVWLIPDLPKSEQQSVGAIEQKLKAYRKNLNRRILPFPYYGLDVIEYDRGNENHRVEFYFFNKPATLGDRTIFGTTKFSYPLVKKSNK